MWLRNFLLFAFSQYFFLKFPLFGNAEIVTLVLDYEHLVTYQRKVAKNKLN